VNRLGKIPWHPALLAATFVVAMWADTMIAPASAGRAFVVAQTIAVSCTLIGAAVSRSWHTGALLATAVLAVLVSKHSLMASVGVVRANPASGVLLLLATTATIVLGLRVLKTRTLPTARAATAPVNSFMALVLIVTLVGALGNGLPEVIRQDILRAERHAGRAGSSAPDIYVLLLDAYPGTSVLASVFDFDNAAFTKALVNRHFDVATDARSNYWFTSLSLGTIFYGEDLHNVPEFGRVISGDAEPRPSWRIALNANPMFDVLREHGYRIVASASGWNDVDLTSADTWLDSGSVNEFETSLLRSTFIGDFVDVAMPDFYVTQKRDRIDYAFNALESLAQGQHDQPVFAWIHIPAPHPPVAVTDHGSLLEWPNTDTFFGITSAQMGISIEKYKRLFTAQLEYVNSRVIRALDMVTRTDPNAVVLVMSDHGPGNPQDSTGSEIDVSARLRNFFAARTPGHQPYPDAVSSVNVLSILFNAYLDTDFALSPNRSYSSTVFGTDAMFHHLELVSETDLH
jgi:hypothetical protein